MLSLETRRFSTWVEKERAQDLAWINENWHIFWPASQLGYKQFGRGALVVSATTVVVHDIGDGCPISYLSQERVKQKAWTDLARMMHEYDPTRELVVVLLKEKSRQSTYRVEMASRCSS